MIVVVQVDGVSKSYGIEPVITEASFRIRAGEKLGLVGRNAAGKTTLLRLIAGLEPPDSGQISIPKDIRIRYVEQDSSFESDLSIIEAVYDGFRDLLKTQKAITRLSHEMASPEVAGSPERLRRAMSDYATLTEEFERADGYSMSSRVAGVLSGLGFGKDVWERPLQSLSGGERTRVLLARVLLSRPDVLLLDEPTNHLDIPSTAWLEDFLSTYPGTVIVVSHDRHFLDQVVTRILEIEDHKVSEYAGNYSAYAEDREERLAQQEMAYKLQQGEIARLEAVLRRYTALSARNNKFARRAEDVRKKLARIERLDKPVLKRKSIGFSLLGTGRSGDQVVRLEDLAMGFGDRVLFSNVRLAVKRGEHVGIIGRNGVGKSTLLHVITGRIQPSAGAVRLGTGVVIGYYDQQHEDLAPGRTVIEEVLSSTRLMPQEARNLLGRFMFRGDDVFKRIEDLSGGERNRVLLAKLMASGCNLLVMDEPTNHLDIDSVQVLEKVLAGCDGTLLIVSHDRYFLSRVADRILALEDGRVVDYPGGYAYYLEKSGQPCDAGPTAEGISTLRCGPRPGVAERARDSRESRGDRGSCSPCAEAQQEDAGSVEVLEKEIMQLEATIRHLNAELADLELYLYPDRMAEKARSLALAEKMLEECYKKWGSLTNGA